MKNISLFFFIALLLSNSLYSQKTVSQLKDEFDTFWKSHEGKKELMAYVNTNGATQQYYYANWNLDGLINMWQATGDVAYFNDAKIAINAMINNAVDIKMNGIIYKGWPGALDQNIYPYGFELWDSMIWKEVSTLLRIMHQSPEFLVAEKNWHTHVLEWTEKNIWDRYANKPSYGKGGEDGNQFMYTVSDTSHWARIAMELFTITKKEKYKSFFVRASYAGCCTCIEATKGYAIRDQFYDIFAENTIAFGLYNYWGDFNENATIADSPHFAAVVHFIALAYQANMYWNKNDIEKLIGTFNNIVWKSDNPILGTYYIDGTGAVDAYPISQGAQAILGRFDESFQIRLENTSTQGWNRAHRLGLIAANRAILTNGKLVYGDY